MTPTQMARQKRLYEEITRLRLELQYCEYLADVLELDDNDGVITMSDEQMLASIPIMESVLDRWGPRDYQVIRYDRACASERMTKRQAKAYLERASTSSSEKIYRIEGPE